MQLVLTDAKVVIGGVDVSAHIRQVTLTYSAEVVVTTRMGDGGQRRLGGLKDWAAEFEPFSDEAAAQLQATVFPLVGTQAALAVRSKNQAIATDNPEYQGNGIITSLAPVSGAVGEAAMAPISMIGSDGVPLIRDITP